MAISGLPRSATSGVSYLASDARREDGDHLYMAAGRKALPSVLTTDVSKRKTSV
jgi:hypothetical protein